MPADIFTISELNSLIKDVVSSGFPSSLWICGEIQNLDRYKSKAHLFFDLVEKGTDAREVKAKLGVTIWAGVRPRIEALLKKAENAFELKDGIEVKFSGKVDFYPPYGTLRFVIDTIDPIYTLGKIAQDRQKLIAELTQAGVLDRNKTKMISPLPLRIGLISAFDSAAYNDFIHELKRGGYAFQVAFVNAVMQGKNCEASVCQALEMLERRDDLDVIVLSRGGGSIAELSAFDSRKIALGISTSRYPVITGIGHEINTSIADLAAHTFVKTPTAAAQFLVEKINTAIDILDRKHTEMSASATEFVAAKQTALRNKALALQERTRDLFQAHKDTHVRLAQRLTQLPLRFCLETKNVLLLHNDSLKRALGLRLKIAATRINSADKLVSMASPARVLKRGFSITRLASGKLIRASQDIRPGDEIFTEVHDGQITSIVK
ncbi:MAG: exodeoxyribonuclease VII large subunit [Candidatus Omnitrophica bacterium]|nr:exodeoxyribonuclease VII large subunit [Candidatus Omnitrophota bacterium]